MLVDIKLKKVIDNSYKIDVGKLKNINFSNQKVAIITNPKVAGLHLNYLIEKVQAKELYIITIPDGEKYKNIETVNYILDNLFNHKFDRNSILIGFGGGVVGDITGFSASLYQRGIDYIQIPTTLLSQVDSSVGGKTGVNNSFGKNLIGTFNQPKSVYIDKHFLTTLNNREIGAGFSEIVKMATIFDKKFFNFLEKNGLSQIEKVIKKSVQLKAKIVSQDEKESGVRASLNYGHTFGHVIENESGYGKYLHGEAVAMGMIIANSVAVKLNLISQDDANSIKKLLEKMNLPTTYKINNIDSFYEKLFLDKKVKNQKIKFVIPNGIGNFVFKDNLSKTLLFDVLSEFQN